ncbi:Pumilio-like 4 [Vitis vinifera]|uniref:Pumilio-like 4 n=1 Tax=Vitis vinifera TaxID=29760 RepID=A0A438FPG0_VITVI|nr:Pumilio-like 4 [Vitis vinifera]
MEHPAVFLDNRFIGVALTKAHSALLKVLVGELLSKVAAFVDPNFDAGESKSRRGRKKGADNLIPVKKMKVDKLTGYASNPQAEFEDTESTWISALLLAILFQDANVVLAPATMEWLALFVMAASKSIPLLVGLLRPIPDRSGASPIAVQLLARIVDRSDTNKLIMAEAGALDALTKHLLLDDEELVELAATHDNADLNVSLVSESNHQLFETYTCALTNAIPKGSVAVRIVEPPGSLHPDFNMWGQQCALQVLAARTFSTQGAGLGPRTKIFADILQEGPDQPASLSSPFPRPASHNAFGDVVDGTAISDCYPAELCNGVESIKSLHSRASAPGNVRLQSPGATVSHSFPSAVGSSLSRSTTPEPQLIARLPVSRLPPVSNRVYPVEKKNIVDMNVQNGRSSSMTELSNITATLSGLSMSRNRCVDENSHLQSQLHAEFDDQSDFLLNMPNGNNQSVQQQLTDKSKAAKPFTSTNYLDLARKNRFVTNLDGQINFPKRTFSSASLYSKVNFSGLSSLEGPSYQNANIPSINITGHVPSGYHVNQKLNTVIHNHNDSGPALSGSGDGQSSSRSGNWVGSDLHSYMEPHGVHYIQGTSDYATRTAASQGDPSSVRNFFGTSHGDLLGLQKVYLETLLA